MGYACRNHDDVALGQVVCFAVLDVRAHRLSGPRRVQADRCSARDERRFAFDHVDDIGFLVVHLDLAGFVAMAAGDGEVRRGHQRSAFMNGGRYFVVARHK